MANASRVEVLSTIATKEAYLELVPKFERDSGHTVTTTWAGTVDMMKRMAAGEVHDLIIMSSTEMDELIRQGKIAAGSPRRHRQVRHRRRGARRRAAARHRLGRGAQARAAGGQDRRLHQRPERRLHGRLIERMGIAAEIKAKFRSVPSGGTIGTIVASGDCEIGFQQVSELVHIKGVDMIGPLPAEIQRVTVFATGVHAKARHPEARQGPGAVPRRAGRRTPQSRTAGLELP